MPYITSTATCGTDYALYRKNESGTVEIEKIISIKGGANCANKVFATPESVVTNVSDKDYELLLKNPEFQRHLEAGFIKVSKIKASESNKGLQEEDKSAPMTPQKYKKQGRKAPIVKLED